jgi:hypothetical protein
MSSFHHSGAGDPSSFDGFAGPYDSSGAGAPSDYDGFAPFPLPLALGAGDPISLADAVFTMSFAFGGVWSPQSPNYTTTRLPDPSWLSQEGGYLLTVYSSGMPLGEVAYRVDFVDAAGQVHPILEPGCYSAVQDGGNDVYAEPDGQHLVFTMPPLPLGVYSLKISSPIGGENLVPDAVLVVPEPTTPEMESARLGIPYTVYSGAWPDEAR